MALRLSDVPLNGGIGFGSKLSSTQDGLSLIVTAPRPIEAQTVGSQLGQAVLRWNARLEATEALRNKALGLDSG